MNAMCRWLSLLGCVATLGSAHAQPSFEIVFTAAEGSQLSGLTPADDGTLYATLARGGAHNQGGVVRRAADGTINLVRSFDAALGGQPLAAMVFGADGALYGTTSSGGEYGFGTIFRLTRSGELSALHHFALGEGGSSQAPLLLADDGNLWGVTHGVTEWNCDDAGAPCTFVVHSVGRVFKLAPDGTWSSVFAGLTAPSSGLTQSGSGDFYGVVSRVLGGSSHSADVSSGDIYRITSDGQVSFGSGVYGYDFNPGGELVVGSDGYLYGVSADTWYSHGPNVFRFSPDYGSHGALFTRVAAEGRAPGGLAFGSDGNLYGAGRAGYFRTTTSGVLTHLRPYDSDITPPTAAMHADSAGGFYVPAGEHLLRLQQTGTAEVLHRFGFRQGNELSTALLTRRGELYGATKSGGDYGAGTLFRVDGAGKLHVLHHFQPDEFGFRTLLTPLVEADDGHVYTVLNKTPAALVRVDDASGISPVHVFTQGSGSTNWLGDEELLIQGQDGALYGSMRGNSSPYASRIYRYDLGTSSAREVAKIAFLLGPSLQASSGDFYAMQFTSSPDWRYDLLRITTSGEVTVLHSFDRFQPASDLAEGPDGAIYVIANDGQSTSNSAVFRWTTSGTFERYAPAVGETAPYFSREHLAFDAQGNLFICPTGKWASDYPKTFVVTPERELKTIPTPNLFTISGPSGELLRVAPLERDGYSGFRLELLTPP